MTGRSTTTRGRLGSPLGIAVAMILAAAPSSRAHAEAPRFVAEVDRNEVITGESFVYQVTLSVGNEQISDYRPPDFKGLRVLGTSGPNQSTQMQFGGAGMFVQVSYSWRYELAATQKGTLNIGAARARVNGQDFRSNVVTVSAAAASGYVPPPPLSGGGPPSPSPSNPSSSAPGAASGEPGAAPPEAAEGGSFIRLVTDKQKAFVGEAITATWYLYMNQPADKYDTQAEPHTEGFWTEDVVVPSRRGGLVLTQEMVQNRPYQVGTVLKKALFPLQVGRLTITPMEAEISRSDFFGNAVRSQRVRSLPHVIEVSPLPKVGQPSGFDAGNVGSYTLNARVDRAQVSVGEPVSLTIEIAGRGNLRKLALPSLPKLEGWKIYDPRVTVVVDPASGLTGTKTAEILLLPERAGAVTLPPLVLDLFDPDARRYTRVTTTPIALTATGDAAAAGRGAAGGAASGAGAAPSGRFTENVLADEIRPLHTRVGLQRDLGTTFFRKSGFVAALIVPPLGFALALLVFRIRDKLADDTGSRRRRRARKKVRAHLASADAHRRRGEAGAFFVEIDRVMREALASRVGVTVKGLRMDELRQLLATRGLAPQDIARIIALLEECDRARFSSVQEQGDVAASLRPILDTASELIDVIERAPPPAPSDAGTAP